mmetsp:Transcript_71534/g.155412  ORF Transcript_71534/g.155412 Transcript_71534/m.155412 type:complete len:217 (-) Transcript_71534:10-660(-)
METSRLSTSAGKGADFTPQGDPRPRAAADCGRKGGQVIGDGERIRNALLHLGCGSAPSSRLPVIRCTSLAKGSPEISSLGTTGKEIAGGLVNGATYCAALHGKGRASRSSLRGSNRCRALKGHLGTVRGRGLLGRLLLASMLARRLQSACRAPGGFAASLERNAPTAGPGRLPRDEQREAGRGEAHVLPSRPQTTEKGSGDASIAFSSAAHQRGPP